MNSASARVNIFTFRVSQKVLFLMGLAPYTAIIETPLSNVSEIVIKFSYSRRGCIYNITLATLITITVITLVPEILKFSHPNYGPLVKIIDTILTGLGSIVVVITILMCCHHQQNIVNVGNQLGDFHQKFKVKLSQKVTSELMTWDYSIIVLIFFVFCVGLVTANLLLYQSYILLSFLPMAIISASFIIQYSLAVKTLKGMIRSVNESISEMNNCLIVFREESFVPENTANPRSITRNLTAVRRARAVICKIADQIIDIYGIPSLLIIFYACCCCVSAMYFLITNFMIQERLFLNAASLNGIMWVLLIIFPISLLSEMVKRFNAEMWRTAELVYDFRETCGLNKDIIYELHDFAVELLHRKVEFTASGFFSLDCTLLHAIFGMVVTYLIILLQYKPLDVSSH
ncbi:putative gustatory receptor 28b [Diachasmimorpha longicaudata]|uniref:putative gustatory receptor 28b n=1 Tax=Diachasmimorpha longicaudata TaxID=58733 RepID=UPI0030B87BB4